MKISKMAIAVLFAAGFLTTSATAAMAADEPVDLPVCAEGYSTLENTEDGTNTCEPTESIEGEVVEPVEGDVEVKPIDSCWTTDDGIDVCARGAEVPITAFQTEPATEPEAEPIESVEGEVVEPVEGDLDVKPIDSCWTTEDGVQACARGVTEPMPASTEETPVDGSGCTVSVDADGNELNACYDIVSEMAPGEEVEGELLKNGDVDESLMYQSGVATAPDMTASNTLAAFGVLVGVLGAFGIAISREKSAK